MNPTRYLVSTDSHGTVYNDLFDGTPQAGLLPDAILTKIAIGYSAKYITSMQVIYNALDFNYCLFVNYLSLDVLCNW